MSERVHPRVTYACQCPWICKSRHASFMLVFLQILEYRSRSAQPYANLKWLWLIHSEYGLLRAFCINETMFLSYCFVIDLKIAFKMFMTCRKLVFDYEETTKQHFPNSRVSYSTHSDQVSNI